MTRNKVILITGPTASGKTALAVSIARKLGTKIISADSRQCFTELNAGVAKPSPAQLAEVAHYFINSHSIHDEINAAIFESFALKAADEVWKTNPTVVMVGGTGLYIKAFCEGLDHIPAAAPEIREQLTQQYQLNGLEWLQQQVLTLDPD